jgi:hypothetical protein
VNWAIIQKRLGYAPRVTYFQQFAERFFAIEKVPQQLGKCWYRRFLSRNPFVRILRSKLLDYKRANDALIENINIFFDRLDDPALAGIPITNFYNANEFGLFQRLGDNGLRVRKAYRKQITVKDAHNLQWIIIIECIRANGAVYPPLVIFAEKHVQ